MQFAVFRVSDTSYELLILSPFNNSYNRNSMSVSIYLYESVCPSIHPSACMSAYIYYPTDKSIIDFCMPGYFGETEVIDRPQI
jgi:hypothetical protein